MPQTDQAVDQNPRDALLGSLEWRMIGPHRGGRVVAVAGDVSNPLVFYFGACAGGVWKTTDAGLTWRNVSDGYFKTAAIGALAVSVSDPNVIYAGTGETSIRNQVSHGDGVYKSTDGGRTWTHLGLSDTRYIGKIPIHPTNPNLVYIAALGHAFGLRHQHEEKARSGAHTRCEAHRHEACFDHTAGRVGHARDHGLRITAFHHHAGVEQGPPHRALRDFRIRVLARRGIQTRILGETLAVLGIAAIDAVGAHSRPRRGCCNRLRLAEHHRQRDAPVLQRPRRRHDALVFAFGKNDTPRS